MANLRIAIAALVFSAAIPLSAAQAGEIKCSHTLAQYIEAISPLEAEAAKARAQADRNPLYISDVAYSEAVLADAKTCIRNLSPVATAAR